MIRVSGKHLDNGILVQQQQEKVNPVVKLCNHSNYGIQFHNYRAYNSNLLQLDTISLLHLTKYIYVIEALLN